jgi:hypothetical protein
MVWNPHRLRLCRAAIVLMPRLPNRLSATTHEAVLINQIIAYLEATKLVPSPDVEIIQTPFGVSIKVREGKRDAGESPCPYA